MFKDFFVNIPIAARTAPTSKGRSLIETSSCQFSTFIKYLFYICNTYEH